MKNSSILILVIVLALCTNTCVKERFPQDDVSRNLNNESSIATPIGFDTTSVRDIFIENIEAGDLIEDDQGLLWFRFNREFINVLAADLVTFPTFNASYAITNNTGGDLDLRPAGTSTIITETFYLDFGYSQGANTEEIDSIVLNNMNLDISVLLAQPVNAAINVNFPGIVYHELPYTKDLILSSNNSFADFMQYTIRLDNSTASKNRLAIDFVLTLNTSNTVIPPGQTIVNVGLNISNVDYQIVYGYIGQHTLNSALQDILIDLDNRRLSGHFDFDHTYFNILSENSFGVPFSFDAINYIYREYDVNNQLINEYPLASNQSGTIAFPDLNQIGQTINDTASIDSDPVRLYFQDNYSMVSGSINANANPNGKSEYNFIRKDSELRISAEYAAPFWGYTNSLSMRDTLPFDYNTMFSSNLDKISRLLFILNFTNAAPINSRPQVYFCDQSGTVLDSMFSQPPLILGSSETDASGKVGSNVNPPVKVEYLENRINKIQNAAFIVVKTSFETIDVSSTPPVSWKMFSDYFFYFHIGVAVNLNLQDIQ